MCKMFLFLIFINGWVMANDPEPAPLADALWKGRMEIAVSGELRNHYLANRMGKFGPTGFLQEKSKMTVDFRLIVQFYLNNVGEISQAASCVFSAEQVSNLEENFKFNEEVTLEGGIIATQEVVQKETKETRVVFEDPERELNLPRGSLRILPDGRIDKKGSVTFEGELSFDYQGKGSYNSIRERRPPSEDFAVLEESANLSKGFTLPLKFNQKIEFRKKPIETSFTVHADVLNPFEKSSDKGKDIFSNNLVSKCKVTLTPLFGKK